MAREASIYGIAIFFAVFFIMHLFALGDVNWVSVNNVGPGSALYGLYKAELHSFGGDASEGTVDFDCALVKAAGEGGLNGNEADCRELKAAQGFAATSVIAGIGMLVIVAINVIVQTRSPWANRIPVLLQSPTLLAGACIFSSIFMLICSLSVNSLFRGVSTDDFFDNNVRYGPGFALWIVCFLTYLALGFAALFGLESPERLALMSPGNEKVMLESL